MGFTTRMYILAFLMTWGSCGKKQLQMFDCFFPDIDFVFGQKLNLATPSWESVEIISTAGNDHMTSPFESMIFVPTSRERWEICDRSQGSEYDCKGNLLVAFLQLQTEPQLAEESLTGVLSGTLSFLLWNGHRRAKKVPSPSPKSPNSVGFECTIALDPMGYCFNSPDRLVCKLPNNWDEHLPSLKLTVRPWK